MTETPEDAYRNLMEGTLEMAEAEIVTSGNMWGGSDTIGGSPRQTGSRLKPEELQKIINDTLEAKK